MANIIVKDIEVAAEKLLSWVNTAEKVVKMTPTVIAALGVLLGAIGKAVAAGESAAAANGLNIPLDEAAWADIVAVWPQVVAVAKALGIAL